MKKVIALSAVLTLGALGMACGEAPANNANANKTNTVANNTATTAPANNTATTAPANNAVAPANNSAMKPAGNTTAPAANNSNMAKPTPKA